jgi:hypothetical protein
MFKLVEALLRAEVNPFLEGDPGIGKTAFARDLARKLGVKSYYVCLSHREGVEVHGNQVVKRDSLYINDKEFTVVEQAPPKYVIEAVGERKGAIIVFDELTRIPPQTAGPTLAIFSEWIIGEVKLPREKIGLIACANPSGQDPGCWKLPYAMSNRFGKLKFKVQPLEWANQFTSYWGDPPKIEKWGTVVDEEKWLRTRAVVSTFIRQFPELLNKMPKDAKDAEFPTCRTWDYLSRVMVTAETMGLTEDERNEIFIGLVGAGAAKQFTEWYRHMDLPDPRLLVDDPTLLKLPVTTDKLFYIVMALAEEVKRRNRIYSELADDKKMTSEGKKAGQAAIKAWENTCALFVAAVKAGCPKDIPCLVSHDLAQNKPRGAKPEKVFVDTFVPIAVAAGMDKWETAGTKRKGRQT